MASPSSAAAKKPPPPPPPPPPPSSSPYITPILLPRRPRLHRLLPHHRRRRHLPTVRLGPRTPRRLSLTRMLRRVRLRWLKLRHSQLFKRLKEYYRGLVKDIIEAGATIEAYQQRLMMETSLAVPMGVSFSSFPSIAAAAGGGSRRF